jgi:hypothetical protein
MTEYYGKVVRTSYYLSRNGVLSKGKLDEDKLYESMNFSWILVGAETISAAVFEDVSCLTLSAVTIASPVLSWTVESVGTATLKITTSAGRIRKLNVEYIATDPYSEASDY